MAIFDTIFEINGETLFYACLASLSRIYRKR